MNGNVAVYFDPDILCFEGIVRRSNCSIPNLRRHAIMPLATQLRRTTELLTESGAQVQDETTAEHLQVVHSLLIHCPQGAKDPNSPLGASRVLIQKGGTYAGDGGKSGAHCSG